MTLGVFNISALRTFAAEVRVLTHATAQWLPLVDDRQTATLKSLKTIQKPPNPLLQII